MGIASEAEAVEIVAGQESGAVVGVGVVIDGYDRSNPLNIVTFSALMSRLRGEKPAALPPAPDGIARPSLPTMVLARSNSIFSFCLADRELHVSAVPGASP